MPGSRCCCCLLAPWVLSPSQKRQQMQPRSSRLPAPRAAAPALRTRKVCRRCPRQRRADARNSARMTCTDARMLMEGLVVEGVSKVALSRRQHQTRLSDKTTFLVYQGAEGADYTSY